MPAVFAMIELTSKHSEHGAKFLAMAGLRDNLSKIAKKADERMRPSSLQNRFRRVQQNLAPAPDDLANFRKREVSP